MCCKNVTLYPQCHTLAGPVSTSFLAFSPVLNERRGKDRRRGSYQCQISDVPCSQCAVSGAAAGSCIDFRRHTCKKEA